jgi:hypothetical protein
MSNENFLATFLNGTKTSTGKKRAHMKNMQAAAAAKRTEHSNQGAEPAQCVLPAYAVI